MFACALASLGAVAVAEAPALSLARAGAVPQERFYTRVEEVDGRPRGKWRRRSTAEFHVDELDDGTVLRVRRVSRGITLEDRRYDAGGWPLVTLYYDPAGLPDRAVVHTQPEETVPLGTWTVHVLPGGRVAAPAPPVDLPGGSVRIQALGGELDVWTAPFADPLSDGFREGLVAGCGCAVVDGAAAWVDGRPGVRYRLLVPETGPPEAVDLWAVPDPRGLWLATFRASLGARDPAATLLAGRVLLALVSFDDPGAP